MIVSNREARVMDSGFGDIDRELAELEKRGALRDRMTELARVDELDAALGEVGMELAEQDAQVGELCIGGESPGKKQHQPNRPSEVIEQFDSTLQTTENRLKRTRRRDEKSQGWGFSGWGRMAAHRATAKLMFNEARPSAQKPMWAVDALVRLRDEGKCAVCGEVAEGIRGQVKRVVRKDLLKESVSAQSEACHVLVCKECAKCWNATRNFYTYPEAQRGWELQRLYVMKRRQGRYKGAKTLSAGGHEKMKELVGRVLERTERGIGLGG